MAIISIKSELKLNKFEFTKPIHVRNLVGRLGYAVMPSGTYTGDETALTPMSKLQMLQYGYRLVDDEARSDSSSSD